MCTPGIEVVNAILWVDVAGYRGGRRVDYYEGGKPIIGGVWTLTLPTIVQFISL